MGEPLSREEVRHFVNRTTKALRPIFSRSVIPIVCRVDGKPVQYGTGTLIRIADESFLITAHHVLETIVDQGLVPQVFDGAQGTAKLIFLDSPARSFVDPFDVSIVRLSQRVVDALPNRKFLRLSDMDLLDPPLRKGLFYVFGYPSCWWQIDEQQGEVVGTAAMHRGRLSGGSGALDKYDPELHVLIEGVKAGETCAAKASAGPLVSWRGVSGCSIWQAYRKGDPIEKWKTEDAKIVAVQTGVYEGGKIIKGTYWRAVAYKLWDKFPQLRPAMRLYRRVPGTVTDYAPRA